MLIYSLAFSVVVFKADIPLKALEIEAILVCFSLVLGEADKNVTNVILPASVNRR